jgi:glycosyltransferase involved in cell wall biosynthesis
MNYKRSIIATTLPYFQEHLTHERSALLVDYADVNGWAAALARLITDTSERARLGQAVVRPDAADSSWGEIAQATLECYRTVICDKSSHRT